MRIFFILVRFLVVVRLSLSTVSWFLYLRRASNSEGLSYSKYVRCWSRVLSISVSSHLFHTYILPFHIYAMDWYSQNHSPGDGIAMSGPRGFNEQVYADLCSFWPGYWWSQHRTILNCHCQWAARTACMDDSLLASSSNTRTKVISIWFCFVYSSTFLASIRYTSSSSIEFICRQTSPRISAQCTHTHSQGNFPSFFCSCIHLLA